VKRDRYLFDTHALIFWSNKLSVSAEFIKFFDEQDRQGRLFVSSISFWEIAFLVQKRRLDLTDIHAWKNELFHLTNLHLIDPSASEKIDSTMLPPHHQDPFDRLLITQANRNSLILVTRDVEIQKYEVARIWL
jgi:PIN domain nuclease of toxin-antitoxin system